MPAISVLMPTYKQAAFIGRAIESLKAQSLTNWELWIINDGSPDETETVVQPYLTDPRIHYHAWPQNQGMGAALNYALTCADAPLIAYLPSDDLYYPNHLASLAQALDQTPQAVLACSGIRHHYNRYSDGPIENLGLQLVQTLHRRTTDRWLERRELVTDDLERMFWAELRKQGEFIHTRECSCEWVNHPWQRHKILQEPLGGINPYRLYYRVREPLHFHTTVGNEINEIDHYRRFRERPDTPLAPDSLKILLVGELAYNAERILALEERGHKLYGLWTPEPHWYNNVGPVPFGHIQDIPLENWRETVDRLQPDIIYALLNWQAVPFAHQILKENPGIPFVWHFKEGPFICLEKGTWPQLVDLTLRSDGQIYSSPEMRDWFETAVPGSVSQGHPWVLDGDLPKLDWLTDECRSRLSEQDGEFHTVVPGRPIGLHPYNVVELAQEQIHLHFYGDFTHGQWREWIEKTRQLAPRYIHLHPHVDQNAWVSEFSQYDAGWLHYFKSENQGDLRQANWDDLNYPARIATLTAAGLPLLQRDNTGARVATQTLVRHLQIGLFFSEMAQLRTQLADAHLMTELRANVWRHRRHFAFDTYTDDLVMFFRQIIATAPHPKTISNKRVHSDEPWLWGSESVQ